MRKLGALAIVACCALALGGVAQASQSNTGCGFGSMVFEGKDGVLSQVCAVTTNGTLGSQTFGITSGTVNCEKPATFAASEKLNSFVGDNMDNLARDISKGSGEYLTTLAVLMDVPVEERAELYHLLQTNFSNIYTSEDITHVDVLGNLETVLSSG